MDLGPNSDAPIERYVVLEYLSEGGMGAIYLGKKLGAGGFEKEVVLKQLLPEFTQQPEFIDLFLREARLSATLDHANIVHTIDLVTAGNEYFIVMEYLDGADLRTLARRARRRRTRFSAAAGICIAREVLSALAYAHAKVGSDGRPLRLIHRDVSPSNVLVSRNGEVKLTDFGIAKAATHTSVFYKVKGKIGYMSPEQARSEPMDHRSDLYSLAVCIYEVITGERLFVAAGLTTTPEQIYGQTITPPSRKVTGLPTELDRILLKALAVDPGERYQTAGELQEALMRCAHRAGLLMSTPELAEHLREVCGPPEQWRDVEEAGAPGHTGVLGGPGTEVYDLGDDDDDDDDEPVSSGGLDYDAPDADLDDLVGSLDGRRDRASSIIDLGRLQNLELTSMINLAGVDHGGARPLVDWGDLSARLSSEPALDTPEPVAGPLDTPPPGPLDTPPPGPLDTPPPIGRAARAGGGRAPGPALAAAPRGAPRARAVGARRWLVPAIIALVVLVIGLGAAAMIGLSGPGVTPAAPTDASAPPAALDASAPPAAPDASTAPSADDASAPPAVPDASIATP